MAIEPVGELLTDVVREQRAAHADRHIFMDEGETERLAAAEPLEDRVGPALQLAREILDELDRNEDFAMAAGLEKSDVLDVRVDHVQLLEVHALAAELSPKLPRHDEVAGDADRPAIEQKERVAQMWR